MNIICDGMLICLFCQLLEYILSTFTVSSLNGFKIQTKQGVTKTDLAIYYLYVTLSAGILKL